MTKPWEGARQWAMGGVAMLLVACGGQTPLGQPDAGLGDVPVDLGNKADVPVCNGGTPQGPAGACRCNADCEAGAICSTEEETGFPGGSCLQLCDPMAPPRPGFLCRTLPGGSTYIPTCGPNATEPCRDGWFCRVYSGATRDRDRYQCEPACSDDAQCHTGRCNRYTGFCDTDETGRVNDAPCTTDMQCRGGVCLSFAAGACSSICDTRTGFCPENGYCLPPVQAASGAHNGTCLARCERLTDCRTGFVCRRSQGQGVCSPDL